MKKIKSIVFGIMGLAVFVASGVRMFAEEGGEQSVYLSVMVTDEGTIKKTEEELSEIAKGFAVVMMNGGGGCTSSLDESGECIMEGNQYNLAQFLGCIDEDSGYSISYKGGASVKQLFSDSSVHGMDLEGMPDCVASYYVMQSRLEAPRLLVVNVRVKDSASGEPQSNGDEPIIFLATKRVMVDQRPAGSKPSAEEIRNRFAIKVSGTLNNPANAEDQRMTADGVFGKVIGEVGEDTQVGVLYEGKAVRLVYAPVLETNSFHSVWRSPDDIEFGLGFALHPSDTPGVQLGELVIAICGDECK